MPSALLAQRRFLVRERAGLLKLTDTYDLFDPDTQRQVGIAHEAVSGWIKLLRLFVNKMLLPTRIEVTEVPDERLEVIHEFIETERIIPASLKVVDIAGLVSGASKGEGLGNKFLANIRETDGIINMVRCFADDNVVHVAGRVDPVSDMIWAMLRES